MNNTFDLFEIELDYIKGLFEGIIYPWNVLPRLGDYILGIDKSEFCEISEGVFVGKDVKIHPSAVIIGPAIIGDETEIRPNAYIRGNVIIGKRCVIGNSTEIKNSVLMNSVQAPHYNYIGDSILGNNTHLGAGTVCSNLKSDKTKVVVRAEVNIETSLRKLGAILGDNAEVGCNCVLNPGTVVGKGTRVYPLTSVRGVIEENSIVKSMSDIVKRVQ